MRRARNGAAAAAALFVWACASGAPAPPDAASRATEALRRAQAEAYAPRRWKALFRGEVAPSVGAVGRGFLTVFWDGATLSWRTSAPLAGSGQSGTLRRDGASGSDLPIPGRLDPAEAIGALLGVPAGDLAGTPTGSSDRVALPLTSGALAVLDGSGRIVEVRFPGGVRVVYEPGNGLPRKVTATSRDGRAVLDLESLAPWPEGEEGR